MKRLDKRRWASTRLQVQELLERDGWRCCQCGRSGSRLEVDHKKRMRDGGKPWDLGNLQTLCRGCHILKTSLENSTIPRHYQHRHDAARLVLELLGPPPAR